MVTLSNIINNAVEAFADSCGNVEVALLSIGDEVQLIVKDNGRGIPPEVLKKIGEKGVTHGKEGTTSGSGLGVYHARKTIESCDGVFEIKIF